MPIINVYEEHIFHKNLMHAFSVCRYLCPLLECFCCVVISLVPWSLVLGSIGARVMSFLHSLINLTSQGTRIASCVHALVELFISLYQYHRSSRNTRITFLRLWMPSIIYLG